MSILRTVPMLAAVLISGCVSSPVTNDRLAKFDGAAGYRMNNIAPADGNSNSLFVVLTFSGGGTRAAAFSYGVLETLRDTEIVWKGERKKLLDEVDVISSVSGGSVTAAYYGLYGEQIFDDFREKVLYANFQKSFLSQMLRSSNYFRLTSPLYTRMDVIAETLSEDIYQRKTFGDLLAQNKRPFIVINATDIVLGSRFGFTQDQFDQLYSDLSQFQVGHAVAASAAVPGVVTPMMLQSFERGDDYTLPPWAADAIEKHDVSSIGFKQARTLERYSDPDRRYIHLSDGGLTDNLGLLPIIQGLLQVKDPIAGPLEDTLEHAERLLIITVNAKADTTRPWNFKDKPLGFFKSIFAATTTPLDNHTDTEIMYTQLLVDGLQSAAHEGNLDSITDVDFVEVGFDHVLDDTKRDRLNALPTSLKLPQEDVDLLRTTANDILKNHAVFQKVLKALR